MSVPIAPIDLSQPKRLHVVGVGGPGMSAIAIVLAEMGHIVSGSDLREKPILDRLRAAGIEVHIGHQRGHVHGVDAVTASTAVPASNIELDEARQRGSLVLSRAGMLAGICAEARSLAVAGTHGKTTTSSMLMLVLAEAELKPSFVIGGDVTDMGTGAQWTGGEWFVVEADESDGTHLELPLHGTILTNVEVDHLDHYGTFDGIIAGFDDYLAQVPGPKVLCADDHVCVRLAQRHGAVTYGLAEGADFRAVDLHADGGSFRFAIEHRGTRLGDVHLPLRGTHNVQNTTGVIAMAVTIGIDFDVAAAALARFGGVARRFDIRHLHGGATLVDDYAHLPTEIQAVLAAARQSGDAWQRIVAVFQPNRYNRMVDLWPTYRDAFVDADLIVLTDIYASGTTPIPGVTGKLVVNAVLDAHPRAHVVWLPRRVDLIEYLANELHYGDVSISMGCGDIATLPDEVFARRLELEKSHRVTDAAVSTAATVLGPLAELAVPLAPFTTYRVGGPAAVFVRPRDLADLRLIAEAMEASGLPALVVGRGSNLLVADAGFRGIAINLAAMASDHLFEDTQVVAGAMVALPILARQVVAASLTGFEWAVGVPGSIGGAVRMNAGGHGGDIAGCLIDVHLFDLRARTSEWLPAERLGLRFRGSDLASHQVVLQARLQLAFSDRETSERELNEIVRWRREHQPGGQNAGSVFVNPIPGELSAGELIDRVGLRGFSLGTAFVSDKHANFIQGTDGGRAADVVALIEFVRAKVADETGFELRSEVRLIGFDGVALDDGPGVTL